MFLPNTVLDLQHLPVSCFLETADGHFKKINFKAVHHRKIGFLYLIVDKQLIMTIKVKVACRSFGTFGSQLDDMKI